MSILSGGSTLPNFIVLCFPQNNDENIENRAIREKIADNSLAALDIKRI